MKPILAAADHFPETMNLELTTVGCNLITFRISGAFVRGLFGEEAYRQLFWGQGLQSGGQYCAPAGFLQKAGKDLAQFVGAVMIIADIQQDGVIRTEFPDAAVALVDFNQKEFRVFIGIKIAWAGGVFEIEALASIDHQDAVSERAQCGTQPPGNGSLAA